VGAWGVRGIAWMEAEEVALSLWRYNRVRAIRSSLRTHTLGRRRS
jgi:hypothetical protein